MEYLIIKLLIFTGSVTIEVSEKYLITTTVKDHIEISKKYVERDSNRTYLSYGDHSYYGSRQNENGIGWTTEDEKKIESTEVQVHPKYDSTFVINESWKSRSVIDGSKNISIIKYSCLSNKVPWVKKYLINEHGEHEWRISIANKLDQHLDYPYIFKKELISHGDSTTHLKIINIEEKKCTEEELNKIEEIFSAYVSEDKK